ncbi:MAG: hypothetical protein KIH63_001515 [Candidatus Saccharibacteria bacterium]|nr:hypothetical protein [Candidatus Saccharibacteria bacterium]
MPENRFVPPVEHFQNQNGSLFSRDPYYDPSVSDLLTVRHTFREIGNHQAMNDISRSVVQAYLGNRGFDDSILSEIVQVIRDDDLGEMVTKIEGEQATGNQAAKEHQQRFESYRDRYLGTIREAATKGLPVNADLAFSALAATHISIISKETALLNGYDAAFQPKNGRIQFQPSYGAAEIDQYVSFHEFTHAVTGFHVRKIDEDRIMDDLQHQGVRHRQYSRTEPGEAGSQPEKEQDKRDLFDEIFTDQIARILFRAYQTGDMPDFRTMTVAQFFERENQPDDGAARKVGWEVVKNVFERIPESEKPIQKLLALQFEYYDPSRPAGQRAPAHREFWQMADKFTNINKVDQIASAKGHAAAKEYVLSAQYDEDLRAKQRRNPNYSSNEGVNSGPSLADILTTLNKAERRSKTQARHGYQRRESSNRFRQSVGAMRAQHTDEYVTSTLAAMEARGMTPAQIKKAIAKQWHPDVTGGDSRRAEYLKTANNRLSRLEAGARHKRPQHRQGGSAQPKENRATDHNAAADSKEPAELTTGS